MIDPSAFRFGALDFVQMQQLVQRPPLPPAEAAQPRVAFAAVLLVLGGAVAALRPLR